MNRHLTLLTTLLLIALAGCATPGGTAVYQPQVNCYIPPGSAPEAVATLTTRCQQDAQGTIEAQAAATRQAVEATGQAVQLATNVAQSTAAAATGTAVYQKEQVELQITQIAIDQSIGNATATMAAQQTRDTLVVQETLAAQTRVAGVATQEYENWYFTQQDTQRMFELQRKRQETWNKVIPWIVGVTLVVMTAGTGVLLYIQFQNKKPKEPVLNVFIPNGNGGTMPVPLIHDGTGYRTLPGTLPHQGGRLALPAGDEVVETAVEPIPLPKLDIGHVLIVGETGAGKSTTMRALLANRPQAVVLDPHAGPGDWPGMQVLGGGRNFTQISEFMDWMVDELSNRAEMRRNGQTAFPPLTVATDEMPAIANELGRDVYANWQRWMREGRKFGLYIIVSTQSTRVKTMGIEGEGDVLNNFAGIVYLGKTAVEEYPELAASMEWPAVLRTKRGPRPVIIPHNPDGPTYPTSRVVEPPQIRLAPRTSQAEQDGRKLDGRIQQMTSANAVGMELGDFGERPSGQFLEERVYPALEWRVRELSCESSARILARRRS